MTSDTTSSTSSDRLLLESDTRVTCPACKHDFGLAEGFAKKALEQFTQASKDMAAKEKALAEREQGLQKQIDKEATEKAQRLIAGEKQYLEGELKDKLAQIAGYQAAELELRKEKNKLAEEKAAVELDVQRRVDNERTAIEEKTRLAETEKSKLREGELKKKIDDMSDKLAEAQRKAAQ